MLLHVVKNQVEVPLRTLEVRGR